ncbi:hypothetical protein SRHO_G00225050 [Serrasalmus rhombeus]
MLERTVQQDRAVCVICCGDRHKKPSLLKKTARQNTLSTLSLSLGHYPPSLSLTGHHMPACSPRLSEKQEFRKSAQRRRLQALSAESESSVRHPAVTMEQSVSLSGDGHSTETSKAQLKKSRTKNKPALLTGRPKLFLLLEGFD